MRQPKTKHPGGGGITTGKAHRQGGSYRVAPTPRAALPGNATKPLTEAITAVAPPIFCGPKAQENKPTQRHGRWLPK
jgi:hypothetical protein